MQININKDELLNARQNGVGVTLLAGVTIFVSNTGRQLLQEPPMNTEQGAKSPKGIVHCPCKRSKRRTIGTCERLHDFQGLLSTTELESFEYKVQAMRGPSG